MGLVSAVRVLVGPVHTTSNSTPLILSSTNIMVQVSVREDPVMMKEDVDDTITEEGARTMREMGEGGHIQYLQLFSVATSDCDICV